MAELQEFFYTTNCHTATILTSTSQQQWKISTQPKGPPLAHSKWHAIENPKSEWCKPQRHPKSARSLHLTDCPWCLHVLGGFAMHFAMIEMLVTSRTAHNNHFRFPAYSLPWVEGLENVVYIVRVLFGLSAKSHLPLCVSWLSKQICNWYNLHLPLLKLREWLRCNDNITWYFQEKRQDLNRWRLAVDSNIIPATERRVANGDETWNTPNHWEGSTISCSSWM